MQLVRLGTWTFVAAAAALGAGALAWGAGARGAATTNPYEQVIGSATIVGIAAGKPFDIRGEVVQRDGGKLTLTLVRTADASTGQFVQGVATGKLFDVSIKLSSGSSMTFNGIHAVSDAVGTLGAVNGATLEQVVMK